jgi:23S rRNA (adenine2503-C2)-methyltransferase
MINGINDGEEDLLSLIEYCKDLLCHVNIINLNNTPGSELKPTSQDNINYWIKTLNSNGVSATQRKSKGADIAGACGQLKNTL